MGRIVNRMQPVHDTLKQRVHAEIILDLLNQICTLMLTQLSTDVFFF